MPPRATYRLQLNAGFTFDDAAAIVPYLGRLGVSHLYASPVFGAHKGSTHGYDVVDYGALNAELGGRPAFDRLAAALKAQGLGLLLDVVPNHMGVGGADNAAWLDLLEWGPEADRAGWFDVDWSADRTDIRGKVLVPFLGAQFGAVLADGGLRLAFDPEDGSFAVWAHDAHKLPVAPLTYEEVLGSDDATLARFGDGFADLMRWRPQVMRRARDLKDGLARAAKDPGVAAAIAARVAHFTGREGDLASWSALAGLIGRQNWKAAFHEVASDDINYRRFFNIATLAGIRMELPAVFDQAHALIFELMGEGVVDGLRIDHVDGLYDPRGYLHRLRSMAPRPDGAPFTLLVEKILGPDEALRDDWPVQGTTGYDFTNLLTGLFIDGSAEAAFNRLYVRATGSTQPFEGVIFDAKAQIIDNEMLSELHRLARAATRVARQDPRTADFTLSVLQRALRLLVASFPVYRTYIDAENGAGAEDRLRLGEALRSARRIDPAVDGSVFDFLERLLTGDLAGERGGGYRRSDVFRCAMAFQQYCGPVMAKGVEDTAFYRYNRFVALNEVGGAPERFGVSVEAFHRANAERAARWPEAMLATSTHDTKRGEDTRARLVALTGMAEAWERAVEAAAALFEPTLPDPARPDRDDRYALLQLLVGAWPADMLSGNPPGAREAFVERLKGVMTKSMREGKRHTTWTRPQAAYEEAMTGLIEAALLGPLSGRFLQGFLPFMRQVAERGARNTFAQTVLKLTVPGLPDIYQGTEGWDLTLVDPDNRRPVDYTMREAALDAARTAGPALLRDWWADWEDGRFKLAVTHRLLDLRARRPELFAAGDYAAVQADDEGLVAFGRVHGDAAILVVAERLARPAQAGAALALPPGWEGKAATSLLTGARASLTGNASALLEGFPAAVWVMA